MIRKVLVANRGEIALRVARACRELGLGCVVVHSTGDPDPAAARLADDVVCIGPAPARHSYMLAPALVEAARNTGADAVHPGYGFLSEDPDFAEICARNGLTFVGPPPEVMAALGDKARAKALMAAAGVPVLAGSEGAVTGPEEAGAVLNRVGLPLIVKAVAGGGGRGMTVVHRVEDLAPAVRRTSAQARAVFGDPAVYLERYVTGARHVEIQVLADDHGEVTAVGGRDCSIQRRHQKLVEEAPVPGLPAELGERIAAAATAGMRAVGFRGAGTAEFLLTDGGEFSFIEVNSRLQVEHPVTEMTTALDLVQQQLLIAAGERGPGPVTAPSGAAIECRINAEDPDRAFAPTPGRIDRLMLPGGPFTRVDSHVGAGDEIGPHYDSLLAKIVTWGPDRESARRRMLRALDETVVTGPGLCTTVGFLRGILDDPDFRAARHTTATLDSRPVPAGMR
ncbi:Biotin carboxylase of acetyl-CoA carboxylase [Pseudonocardia sp. Ae717_Ps2]|nr:biotin carboxylase N-terminal domain-containing protein [Pseudonocardia sp. Ae717_Ps2]OLM27822.1 Biotin carboxylase of acetyl-CoA carboxylase [Pseudonocardia sp. Ae717_Ps2]